MTHQRVTDYFPSAFYHLHNISMFILDTKTVECCGLFSTPTQRQKINTLNLNYAQVGWFRAEPKRMVFLFFRHSVSIMIEDYKSDHPARDVVFGKRPRRFYLRSAMNHGGAWRHKFPKNEFPGDCLWWQPASTWGPGTGSRKASFTNFTNLSLSAPASTPHASHTLSSRWGFAHFTHRL